MCALVPEASTNRFEQAFTDLGFALGFSTERPESRYGRGPDCLWRTAADFDLVIEAKSSKNLEQPLDKDEHGQLLVSEQWFHENYPERECKRVSIHPNAVAFPNAAAAGSFVLTSDKLNELVTAARTLLTELCDSHVSTEKLEERCEAALERLELKPRRLMNKFTQPFKTAKVGKKT